MRRIISFMHISLDGFVAGPAGEMNWITINDEIFEHVGRRVSQGDTALYGRVTFQMMESYWPGAGSKPNASRHDIEHSKWYANARKLVMSRTLTDTVSANCEIIASNVADRLKEMKKGEGEDILLFGSPTATHSLMQMDLVDGYWLFVNPVVLGTGIQLFNGMQQPAKLQLTGTRTFASGVTELNYHKATNQ